MNSLTEIHVPEHVTKLGYLSFTSCKATTFIVGDNLAYMASECFSGSYISQFTFPLSMEIIPVNVLAWARCTKVTLKENVRIIDRDAFSNSYLRKINFPLGLEKIHPHAFFKIHITAEDLELKPDC